jgi:anti-anti-sigma factor
VTDERVVVEVSDDRGRTVIVLRGEIDMVSVETIRDAIEPHLAPQQAIVIDLSGVEFVDSSIVMVLAHVRTRLTAEGNLVVRNPSYVARRVLTLLELEKLIDAIEDDEGSPADQDPT